MHFPRKDLYCFSFIVVHGGWRRDIELSQMAFVLAEVSQMSSRLSSESRKYADKAKDLSRQVWVICPTQAFHLICLMYKKIAFIVQSKYPLKCRSYFICDFVCLICCTFVPLLIIEVHILWAVSHSECLSFILMNICNK
jgi:hypothetical protein